MASNVFRITQDELQPYLYYTVSTSFDLTDATFTCNMRDGEGTIIVDDSSAGCYVTDGTAKQIEYRWQTNDTSNAGTFTLFFTITPDGEDAFVTPDIPIEIVAIAVNEPVTLSDVERQIRQDLADESELIALLIQSTRETCESVTRRALIPTSEVFKLNGFPLNRIPIELSRPPLRSVTSVKYLDLNNVEQTLDPSLYDVKFSSTNPEQPSYIVPVYGTQWPMALDDFESVTICYVCGYGTVLNLENNYETIDIPKAIKQWMLINIANLYENRESLQVGNRLVVADISTLADGLISSYRVMRF